MQPEPRVRVAVIEDNPDNLALMTALLERRYDPLPCNDPQRALTMIRRDHPGVVLLDIGLPGLDGPAILDLIRADASLSELPVVAVTADVRQDSAAHWLSRGFDAFVPKPIVDKGALWAIIDSLADIHDDGDVTTHRPSSTTSATSGRTNCARS